MRITDHFCAAADDDNVMRCALESQLLDLRIFISMSAPANEGWHGLLLRKNADCSSIPHMRQFSSRGESIKALETAALDRKEGYTQSELIKLGKSYRKIEVFATVVGNQSGQVRQEELSTLVWSVSLAVIKLGFSKRLRLATFVECITCLNDKVPDFAHSTEPLAGFPVLQEPLQGIYTRYIDSHLEMARIINESGVLERDDILPYFEESGELFGQARKEYEKIREIAQQVADFVQNKKTAPPQFERLSDKPLGSGTYGKVYKVREISTGQLYALKRIAAGSGSSQVSSDDRVRNEMKVMRKLSHHHITTLAYSTKDRQGFSLYILPVAECDLGAYLETHVKNSKYTQKQIYAWFGCLIGALDYAHRNGIKHKDMKPGNILIDESGERIMVTDFGLAKDFSAQGTSRTTGPVVVGTPKYFAPECTSDGERTEAVDVFALGCIYAEILSYLGGQSLTEFDKKRKGWGGVEFRDSLEDVKRWLKKQKDMQNEKKNRIVTQTLDMLAEDVDERANAPEVCEKLTNAAGLRCARCSNER